MSRRIQIGAVAVWVLVSSPLPAFAQPSAPSSRPAPDAKYRIQFGTAREAPPPRPIGTRPGAEPPKVVVVEEQPSAVSLVKPQGPSVAVAPSEAPVLARGELLLSARDEPPKPTSASREGASAFRMPVEARFVDNAGTLRTTEIVTERAGEGLRILGSATTFAAELFVKLQDRADPTSSTELPRVIEVLVTATVDTVVPELLEFTRLGEWKKVALTAANPADQVTVKLRGSDNVEASLPIPVVRPKTTLSISPTAIQGFGVETADVTVRVEGLPSPEGRTVVLQSTLGRLGATRITLNSDGIGATELRSEGYGVAELRGSSPPLLAADRVKIPFGFPWPFLVSSLLGGAIGGTVHFVWSRKKNKRKASPLDIAVGLLVGLVAAGLGVLGLNYTSFDVGVVGNEIAVLVVAAGGALAGPEALLALAKLKSPGNADPKPEG